MIQLQETQIEVELIILTNTDRHAMEVHSLVVAIIKPLSTMRRPGY